MTQNAAYDLLGQIKIILDQELSPLTPIDPNDPDILAKIDSINTGINSIDTIIHQIDLVALKGDKGDKGDPALPAPYGFFDLGAATIPAQNAFFVVGDPLYGDLTVSNGNILLKSGFSYDIEVNFLVNFTSTSAGYLVYNMTSPLFNTPLFQEVAMVSSASGYRDTFPLRFITPKIQSDIEINLIAGVRSSCTALLRGHILVRGHNA